MLAVALASFAQAATVSTCGTTPTTGCFPSIADALAAAAPGDTIDLAPGTYAEQVAITQDVDLVAGGAVRWIDPADAIDGAIVEVTDATVTITGVSFATTRVRPLLAIDADVTLSSCKLQSSGYQPDGGLAHVTRGRLAIESSALGPAMADRGGHVFAVDADVVLHTVDAREGRAWNSGGSVYVGGDLATPDVSFEWSTFERNWSAYEGAVLHGEGDLGTVTFHRVAASGNDAGSEGVVSVDGGDLVVRDSTFRGETGGALTTLWGTLTIEGSWIGDNDRGVRALGPALTVLESAFVRNQGGALQTDAATTITRSVFCENRGDTGAALELWVGSGSAELWNNLFFDNAADYRGGAIELTVDAGGAATLAHNDFLGNTAAHGSAVWWEPDEGGGWDVEVVNNLFAWQVATAENVPTDWTFAWASVVQEFPRLEGNLFWQNDGGDVKEWAVESTVYADPRLPYWQGSASCPEPESSSSYGVTDAVHVSWYGAAVDAGVDTLDPDDSPADIGATGGPLAWSQHWRDLDHDDWPWVYDCWDSSGGEQVNPGVVDPPYDWNDQDCDLTSDLDADKDGYDRAEYGGGDCSDFDPLAHPGAVEIPHDGVDQDCDGFDELDHDRDGWEHPRDCDDYDATVNPGQVDDDPTVDRDCDGTVDVAHRLVARGCASSPGGPPGLALLAGLALAGIRGGRPAGRTRRRSRAARPA